MENRIALLGIIVEDPARTDELNALLHRFSAYIIGRMGIPYKPRDIGIISVILDAPEAEISNLAGKIGMIPGITVKTVYSKK